RAGVRAVAAIPALSLLAGSALGLLAPDIPSGFGLGVLIACAIASFWMWRSARPLALAALVSLAFLVGGTLLAADAWRGAWRPSLRVVFEELARAERAQATVEHRVLPEDDEAFAIVEGVLRSDAAVTESGVALSIDVTATRRPGPFGPGKSDPVTGGILATVLGTLASDGVDLWRAGRRVRVPIGLRRPSRYLDPGVADHERALARRGIT